MGWNTTGWRKSAIVNIGLMFACLMILIGVLAAAISATGNVSQSYKFYTASCVSATTTNTILHLAINILSTIILASSNFFMQVLNAPTAREIDTFHARGIYLDIGIPSWRNAFRLSWLKLLAWLGLLLTSIPIHMLFNSTVFQMDRRVGDFHMTIATEDFLEGGSYFHPGASLYTNESSINIYYPTTRKYYNFADLASNNYSAQATNVSNAATHGSNWTKSEPGVCRNIYSDGLCVGLKQFGNLILVIKGSGWRRSDLWNLSDTAEDLWEPLIPRTQLNTLWYNEECSMVGSIGRRSLPQCAMTCSTVLNMTYINDEHTLFLNTTQYYATSRYWRIDSPTWNTSLYSAPGNGSYLGARFQPEDFEIAYCRAEPRETGCDLALSKPLLLAVVVSIFTKLIICVVVMRGLRLEEPLATPGDAIASFISSQFESTAALNKVKPDRLPPPVKYRPCESLEPRRWTRTHRRRASAIPCSVWTATYVILSVGLVATFICLGWQLTTDIPL
ncbi:hypothetical protein CKAH01_17152 [Colletotrichum kahawae]|uniref:DUF6536 domain-containing protein n=1 Tax=Colletotrichum kahawae TaxID=34407 RepID=A0AAD9YEA1_COLKA|nr:hypothetical protein CKAH01_17152 [Colletotrichum kahawae]